MLSTPMFASCFSIAWRTCQFNWHTMLKATMACHRKFTLPAESQFFWASASMTTVASFSAPFRTTIRHCNSAALYRPMSQALAVVAEVVGPWSAAR